MDKVQIYTAIIVALGLSVGLVTHGQPRTGQHDFRFSFAALVLALPYFGRVFHWW